MRTVTKFFDAEGGEVAASAAVKAVKIIFDEQGNTVERSEYYVEQ